MMNKNEVNENEAGNVPALVENDTATIAKARRQKLKEKWSEESYFEMEAPDKIKIDPKKVMGSLPDGYLFMKKGTGRRTLKRTSITLAVVFALCVAQPTWEMVPAKWNNYQAQRAYDNRVEHNKEIIDQAKIDFTALAVSQKAEAKKRGDTDFDKTIVKMTEQFENKLDQLRTAQDQSSIDSYVKSSIEELKSYFLRDDINNLLNEGLAISKEDDKLWSQLGKEFQTQRGKAPKLTDSNSKDFDGRVRFLAQLKARKSHLEGSIVLAKKLLDEQKVEREGLEKRYIDGLNAYSQAKNLFDQNQSRVRNVKELHEMIPNLPRATTTTTSVSRKDNDFLANQSAEFEELAQKYQVFNDKMEEAIDAYNERINGEKAASAAKYGLTVRTVPTDAQVYLLGIPDQYKDGVRLESGNYSVKVKASGYEDKVIPVRISDRHKTIDVRLERRVVQSSQKPVTETAEAQATQETNPLKSGLKKFSSLFGN